MARVTFREILHKLDGCEFEDSRALQEAVRQAFNKRVLDFPPGYTHFDVIKRGIENGWIEVLPNNKLAVQTGEKQLAGLTH